MTSLYDEPGKQAVPLRGRIGNLTDRNCWASADGYLGVDYPVLGALRAVTVSAMIDFRLLL